MICYKAADERFANTNRIIKEDMDNILKQPLDWIGFKDKYVLVTGGTGLVGSYCIWILLAIGANVIALVRNRDKAEKLFGNSVDYIVGDVSVPFECNKNLDYVIHAAGIISRISWKNTPVDVLEVNAMSTYYLLKNAVKNKVKKFLYISSNAVYGNSGNHNGILEENDYGYIDIQNVGSTYAMSKKFSETLCIDFTQQYGLDTAILRIPTIYGAMQGAESGNTIPQFIEDALSNKDITLQSDGSAMRANIYCADAVLAMFCVLLKGVSAKAYNAQSKNSFYSIIDTAKAIAEIASKYGYKISVKAKERDEFSKTSIIGLNDKLIIDLGYESQVSLKEGLERTIVQAMNKKGSVL
ncbi:MAG: NAD(P)-dependent oxidoreductase [Spirochaetaceae bacterium]|jgi:nucleoside-diphosphate-sugar epimerase|nr:NAD(P)-dependent oxidoreductase [Spirochaetaceae bacterium]